MAFETFFISLYSHNNSLATDATEPTRKRCWQYDWLLEFDIKGLFDNIPHDLLIKAVEKHTQEKWITLCLRRWLNAPIILPNGKTIMRDKGTPQGGVISPVLSNLFLHYVFDKWMQHNYPKIHWCRYADDGLVHCKTEKQALAMLKHLAQRFNQCGLEVHSDKTKVVYCKDSNRKDKYSVTSFDYLGYAFKPRLVRSRDSKMFVSFTPAVSEAASKAMRDKIRSWKLKYRVELSLEEIATQYNPILKGWMEYYGKYSPSSLEPVWTQFNAVLVKWVMRKYKKINGKTSSAKMLESIQQMQPALFPHWQIGVGRSFA